MCNKLEQVFSQLANAEISNKDNVYTIVVAKENLRQAAETLRNNDIVRFDFLRDIIGMDYTDSLGVIYNLSPSEDQSVIVLLESRTDDRENPAFDPVAVGSLLRERGTRFLRYTLLGQSRYASYLPASRLARLPAT